MPFLWNDFEEKLTGGYIANHSSAGVCRENIEEKREVFPWGLGVAAHGL